MARRRIDIKKIEDRSKRQITFTKRRQGLFKKAGELRAKFDAQVAVIAFSMAGNAYAFGDPSVNSVISRYNNIVAASPPENHASPARESCEWVPESEAEKKVGEILDKARETNGSRRLWDAEIANLGFDELEELKNVMEDMKRKIVTQENRIKLSNTNNESST